MKYILLRHARALFLASGLFALVVGGFAFYGAHHTATAQVMGACPNPAPVQDGLLNVSANPGSGTVALSVDGILSGRSVTWTSGTNEEDEFCQENVEVATSVVSPTGAVTILSSSDAFVGETIIVGVVAGTNGQCDSISGTCSQGTRSTFLGNRSLDTSALTPGASYTLDLQISDNFGWNGLATVSFVAPAGGPLSVDLKVRESGSGSYTDGPITIDQNDPIDLQWTVSGASDCDARAVPADSGGATGWSGSNPSVLGGTKTVSQTSQSRTYTIECDAGSNTVTDSVVVNVDATPPPAGECTFSCAIDDVPTTVEVGDIFNVDVQAQGWSSTCDVDGGETNRNFFLDLDGDGTYEDNTGYSGAYTSQTTGSGKFDSRSYASEGTKTLTARLDWRSQGTPGHATASAVCTQIVEARPPNPPTCEGTITINSNVATTWSLSGPTPQTQSTAVSSQTYTAMGEGTYTLTAASVAGHTGPTYSPAQTQTLSCGGDITFDVTYTPDTTTPPPPPPGSTPDFRIIPDSATVGVGETTCYAAVYDADGVSGSAASWISVTDDPATTWWSSFPGAANYTGTPGCYQGIAPSSGDYVRATYIYDPTASPPSSLTDTASITIEDEEPPVGGGAVDLQVNGADSATVTTADDFTLSWTSSGFVGTGLSCTASGGTDGFSPAWPGAKAVNGSEDRGPVSASSYTYTLLCEDSLESAEDLVTVTVVEPQCSNGEDDDRDGLVDDEDPGCENPNDDDERDNPPPPPQCSDGEDNDGDGQVDDEDSGCQSPDDDDESDAAQCSDGLDNDGDGFVDHESVTPAGETPEPTSECESPTDNDERSGPDIEEF